MSARSPSTLYNGHTRFSVLSGIVVLLLATAAEVNGAQVPPDKVHAQLYKKVAPSIVYVEAGGQQGSGVIVDPSGIIVTSTTACGRSATTATIVGHGNRQWLGRVMGRVPELELAVIKIDSDGETFPALELGDSDEAQVGQVTYVFGDSFDSILNDAQPAISLGVLSGRYKVRKAQSGTSYVGTVLETSAAVNPNQDGGPLVDREGRVLGIIMLNYDPSRFTGLAIPINVLKEDIHRLRGEYGVAVAVRKAGETWLGASLQEEDNIVTVTRVSRNGPAGKAGLRRGDRITTLDGSKIRTVATLRRLLGRKAPGDTVTVNVLRDEEAKELKVTLARRPLY